MTVFHAGSLDIASPKPLHIAAHVAAPQVTSKKDSPLTRSLRVPEDNSRASTTLGQVAQTVSSIFEWRTSSNTLPVTPRKLNVPAGSVRHYAQVAALQRAASARDDVAADVTLGEVVTKLLNPGTLVGEDMPDESSTSENSRRSLAQTASVVDGLGLSVRVVSVLNVRAGQLGSATVELVDQFGAVMKEAGALVLDWGGSFLVGPTGGKVGLSVGPLQKGVVVVTFTLPEVSLRSNLHLSPG